MDHNLTNSNFQRLNGLTLSDRVPMGSSYNETKVYNSFGQLVFEYFEVEWDQPHVHSPIYNNASPFSFEIFTLYFLSYCPIFCFYFDIHDLFSPLGL